MIHNYTHWSLREIHLPDPYQTHMLIVNLHLWRNSKTTGINNKPYHRSHMIHNHLQNSRSHFFISFFLSFPSPSKSKQSQPRPSFLYIYHRYIPTATCCQRFSRRSYKFPLRRGLGCFKVLRLWRWIFKILDRKFPSRLCYGSSLVRAMGGECRWRDTYLFFRFFVSLFDLCVVNAYLFV